MKKITFTCMLTIIAGAVLCPLPSASTKANTLAPASASRLRIVLRTLWCGKTTELGEDEIYVLIAGSNSKTGTFTDRVPGGHWDTNDSGTKQDQHNLGNLVDREIPSGSTTDLDFVFMEEDGGNPGGSLKIASLIATKIGKGEPVVTAAGVVL